MLENQANVQAKMRLTILSVDTDQLGGFAGEVDGFGHRWLLRSWQTRHVSNTMTGTFGFIRQRRRFAPAVLFP